MFELSAVQRTGILALDADGQIPKTARGPLLASGAIKMPETIHRMGDFPATKFVEPGNTTFWKHSTVGQLAPRGAWGSWSFAMPYMTKVGANARPMDLKGHEDPDFEDDFVYTQPYYGGDLPQGLWGIAASTTNHGLKDKIGVISGGPLVAHWRGNRPPSYSRHVFDISGDSLDSIRHAGLHTAWEVRKWVLPCQQGVTSSTPGLTRYAIALNGKASADNTGHLFATFYSEDAHLSYSMDGPLRPATRLHEHGYGDSPIRAGAIDTKAYFTGGNYPYDGPLDFIEEPYPEVKDGITPYRVWRKFDFKEPHLFRCGPRKGKWKEYVRLPISETPPCTPTKKYSEDSNGNPTRTFQAVPMLVTHQKVMSQGIYFQPRANIQRGRP